MNTQLSTTHVAPRAWLARLTLAMLLAGLVGCSGDPGAGKSDAGTGDVNLGDGGAIDATIDDTCVPACLPGYVCRSGIPGQKARCVADPARACAPCSVDAQCLGGFCAAIGDEGPFCLIPCDLQDSQCPEGLSCGLRGGAAVCVPDGDSCSCLPGTIGATRACDAGPDASCGGQQTCGADGWGGCAAKAFAPETCNGVDDDCDGLTDEDTAPAGSCSVVNALGSCPGTWACSPDGEGGAKLACEGASASDESCNNVDDDCDGQTDEPWRVGLFTYGDAHCGVCGNSCDGLFDHGVGACDGTTQPPHCAVASCDQGYVLGPDGDCVLIPVDPCGACQSDADCAVDVACVDVPKASGVPGAKVCALPCGAGCASGFACSETSAGKRCLPQADVCSCTAKTLGAKRACVTGNAFGGCGGVQSCAEAGWSACSAKIPAEDTCNGFDDDCDGKTDEETVSGTACAVTNAAGSCKGVQVCLGAAGLTCDAKTPATDVCNGLDDDCDGQVDQGALDPATGLYLSPQHCGGCDQPCPGNPGPHAQTVCVAKAGKPTCGVSCDGGWVDTDGQAFNGCECQLQGDDDVPDGKDANCDGIDGNLAKAIFVAPTGSDTWPGTREQPMRTVAAAVNRAASSNKRDVYAQGGQYAGIVTAAPGVHVYGGFGPGWVQRQPAQWPSTLLGTADAQGDAFTVVCSDFGAAKARLDGFTIQGGDASAPGRSSYAVVSGRCGPSWVLSQLLIQAGSGADGSPGASGVDGAIGTSGTAGKGAKDIGTPNCKESNWNLGGKGGARTCGGTSVAGGDGGTAICPDFHDTIDAPQCPLVQNGVEVPWKQTTQPMEPGKDGSGVGAGKGGSAGADSYIEPLNGKVTACKEDVFGCIKCETAQKKTTGSSGTDGADGVLGASGAIAASEGSADKTSAIASAWRFAPPVSADGGNGSDASGGGGGGAAGGVEVRGCFAQAGFHDVGGSGGGGGSGGCAGLGGKGGTGGGGAFGLWLIPATGAGAGLPTVQNVTVVGGKGGNGGKGGAGGKGGYGGFGGKGGQSAASQSDSFCSSKGGNGGSGGNGGHGGGGGGGRGGPAWAIVALDMTHTALEAYAGAIQVGGKGVGGNGGAGGASAGAAGATGAAGGALALRVLK